MLRNRLITVLTFSDGVLFRTKDFQPDYRYTANFVDAWSVDEIVLLDITRPGQGERQNFYRVLEDFASRCFVPICAGGGIRDFEEARTLLRSGADKIALNTALRTNPSLVSQLARSFGSQSVVASIDARQTPSGYEVFTDFGAVPTGESPEIWAQRACRLGAGEILLCSIDRDGSLEGYDNELNQLVSSAVNIPVLGVGGAGNWEHFVQGFNEGGVSAVCTSNIFHFTESAIKSAKRYLAEAGINVRVS
jgi:cyclase